MSLWQRLYQAPESSAEAHPPPPDGEADLTRRLDALLEELGKLGREQFRATTLLEGQGVALDDLAEAWREHAGQRERESANSREALSELEGRLRLGLVKDLLPVADALDASLASARALLAEPPARPAPSVSWLVRLCSALLAHAPGAPRLARLRRAPAQPPSASDRARGEALEAWLEGLLLVQRRLLALLEREGVRPIPALGQPFDPHRHLAVSVRRDSRAADGTVVAEELRGYLLGERILRHAEVVVARGSEDGGPSLAALADDGR